MSHLIKLTISADASVIAKAHRVSKRCRTSVSAMFSNYILSLKEETPYNGDLPPFTKKVLEMGASLSRVPKEWDYRSELSDALSEKHGVK